MDNESNDHVCKEIKDSLDRIEGIKESFVTPDSEISDIAAIAEWSESEIKNRLSEIRLIKSIKSVDAKILVPA